MEYVLLSDNVNGYHTNNIGGCANTGCGFNINGKCTATNTECFGYLKPEERGLSKFRLYSTAHIVDRVKVLDKEFEILVSNNTEVITQYYVVESSWREFPETNRIISLAQINFRLPSTPIFVKWQPCLFGLSMTKECFMGMLNNKLEK